ncbi:afadin- and alpha-actinin-binding isoform X1 [Brachionus plicatilis]|uniref:Afadin-and alpha-actinin-binding isoform X1 n=1 Tax=Brachionus plicatilis TaxID=10195 RepID=A0A3M7Q495_BRAPC|nr:afadin- and alpha-actinin-binding isoform X1 [Brachionus plicatilis]
MSENIISNMSSINSMSTNDSILNSSENEIDLKAFRSLNSEMDNLGYESIGSLNAIDINKLIKFSLDLAYRFRRQSVTIERLQDQIHLLDRENELFLKRQQNLKDSMENSSRESQIFLEKNRQSENKITEHVKNIKTLSEENRKLQHIIEQRDKQFKNEKKKTEKETEKLKLKIQNLTTIKTKELANIDLTDPISKKGSRPTWNLESNQSKKQLEMYSELIKDYDKKLKQIIIENNDLKTFISRLLSELDELILSPVNKNCDNSIESMDSSNHQKLINCPFDEIFQNLNEEIQSKIKILKIVFKNNCDSLIPRDNVTISSIESLSEILNKTLNNSDEKGCEKSVNKTKVEFNQSKLMLNNTSISSSSLSSTTSSDSRKCNYNNI